MGSELVRRRRRLDAARSAFTGLDPVPAGLDEGVGESWRRCASTVPPAGSAPVVLPDADARWADSPIRRAAPEVLDELGALATGEDYIAAVTDGTGHIIWSAAGRSMARLAEEVNFVRGARWEESVAGTNAPGLALRTGRPATVFATEHWCESVQDWVCYAAPVRSPSGRVLGVLDLSALWERASPLALTTVVAMSRLVEQHLLASPWAHADLDLRVLGRPAVAVSGEARHLSLRQLEILTVLAVRGGVTGDELHEALYGDRPVSQATLKAEVSHLRQHLGGAIDSRPYRLALGVDADVVAVLEAVRRGDLDGAVRAYGGQLLPASESPWVVELRHHVDVALRTALLQRGRPDQLLRFADVHPFDVEVLERARTLVGPDDPLLAELAPRFGRAGG